MRLPRLIAIAALLLPLSLSAQSIFIEAEGFSDLGGWTNDNQSMMQMGSPYIIAHGLGRPVADATTRGPTTSGSAPATGPRPGTGRKVRDASR